MTENENQQSNWLAIASFVLGLIWSLLCLIIIGLPLWIICLILALIFGIIALCKKQAKRAWILWIIFSILWMIIVAVYTTVAWKFIFQHKEQFMNPITDFSARVEENPDIAALMENDEFSEKFDAVIEQRLQEKYWEKFSDIDSIDWIVDIRADLFEEMKNVATELAEQEWINAIVPVDVEETADEVHECGDFYKTEEEIVCTEQYEPVCWNNGQTYGNSCFACIEVDSYTDWECAEAAPAPAAKLMVQEWQTEEETQAMIQETCTNAWGQLVDGNCILEDGSVIAF